MNSVIKLQQERQCNISTFTPTTYFRKHAREKTGKMKTGKCKTDLRKQTLLIPQSPVTCVGMRQTAVLRASLGHPTPAQQ